MHKKLISLEKLNTITPQWKERVRAVVIERDITNTNTPKATTRYKGLIQKQLWSLLPRKPLPRLKP